MKLVCQRSKETLYRYSLCSFEYLLFQFVHLKYIVKLKILRAPSLTDIENNKIQWSLVKKYCALFCHTISRLSTYVVFSIDLFEVEIIKNAAPLCGV